MTKNEREIQNIMNMWQMVADLKEWSIKNMDNENVSDGLYGFVKDMIQDLKREAEDAEREFILRKDR